MSLTRRISSLGSILLTAITLAVATPAQSKTIVYVSEGKENRIGIFDLNPNSGSLSRIGEIDLEGAPGSLAISADQEHLYASVRSAKQLATLKIDPDSGLLSLESMAPAAGGAGYLFLERTGQWLLASYYGEGTVSVSRIDENGLITQEPVQVLEVGDKAHCIQTDPSNRFAFCPHPGTINKIDCLHFDAATGRLAPNEPAQVIAAEGQGPRHLQFHPNGQWVFAVNEQEKSVTRYEFDAEKGGLKARETIATIPSDWDSSQGSCADIEITKDGRFLYASNRGHDSIAMFSIDPASGTLTSLGQVPTEKTPRSFNLIPGGEDFVVSAGQGSGTLAVYRRDSKSGKLSPLKTYDCGKGPAWVLGVRLP